MQTSNNSVAEEAFHRLTKGNVPIKDPKYISYCEGLLATSTGSDTYHTAGKVTELEGIRIKQPNTNKSDTKFIHTHPSSNSLVPSET